MEIDRRAFSFAINKINDGWVFEDFGSRFLSAVLGNEFIPVGGTRDKGIDGFQHVLYQKDRVKKIFQLTIEQDYLEKIEDTAVKLLANNIDYQSLTYVTNRKLSEKDRICDDFFDKHDKTLRIFDQIWFETNCNYSEGTIRAYNIFVDSYLHEYNSPGKSSIVSNLDGDSRIYVFLRQQLDKKKNSDGIDVILADTLILYALEGTDPDKEIFKTKDEIFDTIKKLVKFEPKLIEETIIDRLDVLSKKQEKKINHHAKIESFCLPYSTREEIRERNFIDSDLHETFIEQTGLKLRKYLKESTTIIRNLSVLIDETINKIYYHQGLEFSNFILSGESENAIEKELSDVISKVVDESTVINKNKQSVKVALTMTVRDIVYNGTVEQKKYLSSLSNTYMMMFMLQCDPKVATFFQTLAGQLRIFVGNSIIIPALSEFYLEESNKRHWKLLVGCNKAGVKLIVNDSIIDELVDHFRRLRNSYYSNYHEIEAFYLDDEIETLYIDKILIRAYFYAKLRGRVQNFDQFLDNFISPDLSSAKNDLIEYLFEEFGINYCSNTSLEVTIDQDEVTTLSTALETSKGKPKNAEKDVDLILTVYGLREKDNESSSTTVFGYKTWWLSKDSLTYKDLKRKFGDKYPISCYIRPDFLYNYIALAPNKEEVDGLYEEIFPTLLGVNLSYHLPREINDYVTKVIGEHKDRNPKRVKSIIRRLTEDLKTNPNNRTRKHVKHFLDDELEKMK